MGYYRMIVFFFIFLTFDSYSQSQVEDYSFERNGYTVALSRHFPSNSLESGKHILLVHGLTYSSHEFDIKYTDYSVTDFLVSKGYTVWLIDITGYGRSDRPEDGFAVTSECASQDIVQALKLIRQEFNPKELDVLGWSWGTVTSSLAIGQQPALADKLLLYAPIATGFDGSEPTDSYHTNTWEHAASDFVFTAKGDIDYDIVEPEVAHLFLSNCWKYDQDSSPNGGRADLMSGSAKKLINLEDVKIPVLLIAGTADPLLNMKAIEALAKQANVTLKKVEGGSHVLMMEKAHYLNFQHSVLGFLNSKE